MSRFLAAFGRNLHRDSWSANELALLAMQHGKQERWITDWDWLGHACLGSRDSEQREESAQMASLNYENVFGWSRRGKITFWQDFLATPHEGGMQTYLGGRWANEYLT